MRELAEKLYADMKSICRLDLQANSLRKGSVGRPELKLQIQHRISLLRSECRDLDAEHRQLLLRHIQTVISKIRDDASKKNWAEQILTLESLAAIIYEPDYAIIPATPKHFYDALFHLEYEQEAEEKRAALHEQINRLSTVYKETAYTYIMKYWSSVPRVRRLLGLLDTRFEASSDTFPEEAHEKAA